MLIPGMHILIIEEIYNLKWENAVHVYTTLKSYFEMWKLNIYSTQTTRYVP